MIPRILCIAFFGALFAVPLTLYPPAFPWILGFVIAGLVFDKQDVQ